MSIESEIHQTALDIARQLEAQAVQIERELADVETRKTELLTQRDTARRAQNRLSNFQIAFGSDYQCPRCWIQHEARSTLMPTPSTYPRVDIFHCGTCGFDLGVPF